MDDTMSIALYGYDNEDMKLLISFLGPDVMLVLQMLKHNLSTAAGSVYLGVPRRTLHRKFVAFLQQNERWALDPRRRFAATLLPGAWERCTMLVDGFPVFRGQRRGGGNFSGKYRRSGLKFQMVTDVRGVPMHLSEPFDASVHDAKIFRLTNFEHLPNEMIVADKAYIGAPHCIVPRKKSRLRPLSVKEKKFEAMHRKVRAKVEHCFARLHRFRFMKYSYWRDTVTANAVRFITWAEHVVRTKKDVLDPADESFFAQIPLCECDFQRE